MNGPVLDDGTLKGTVGLPGLPCEICGQPTLPLDISQVILPAEVTVESTILNNRRHGGIFTVLGITCGCYAKFHRQVVHIQEKLRHR